MGRAQPVHRWRLERRYHEGGRAYDWKLAALEEYNQRSAVGWAQDEKDKHVRDSESSSHRLRPPGRRRRQATSEYSKFIDAGAKDFAYE